MLVSIPTLPDYITVYVFSQEFFTQFSYYHAVAKPS
nr:MAG TPA: hypothetical protein [Caudoviricetes sp.]